MRPILLSIATIVALLTLAATATAQSLTIIEPNGGETFTAGVSSVTVSWLEAGIESDDEIEVEFTVDGTNWRRIDRVGPDIRTVSWIPDRSGTNARVRVTSKNNPSVTDQSDATFVIEEDPNAITAVIAPNGGEVWPMGETRTISFDVPADAVNALLELSTNGGSSWTEITTVPATQTQYAWRIPLIGDQDITTALIRVSVAEAVDHFDVSDAPFTLRARPRATLRVLAPNGGERFRVDSSTTVLWSMQNMPEDAADLRVDYSVDSGRTWVPIATEDPMTGSHAWIVPRRPTRRALVRVVSTIGTLGDTSNAVFEIYADSATPPPPDTTGTDSIRISEPKGGETWHDGESQRIVWSSSVTADTVEITAIVRVPGGSASTIGIASAPVASGAVTWIVPRLADSLVDARIVVRLSTAGTADTSDAIEIRHTPAVSGIGEDGRGETAMLVYPNPASTHLTLRVAGSGESVVRLMSTDGRVVRDEVLEADAADLSLEGLASGTYVVEVETAGIMLRRRIVVLR